MAIAAGDRSALPPPLDRLSGGPARAPLFLFSLLFCNLSRAVMLLLLALLLLLVGWDDRRRCRRLRLRPLRQRELDGSHVRRAVRRWEGVAGIGVVDDPGEREPALVVIRVREPLVHHR